jgi:hypothetical protein
MRLNDVLSESPSLAFSGYSSVLIALPDSTDNVESCTLGLHFNFWESLLLVTSELKYFIYRVPGNGASCRGLYYSLVL